MPRSSHQFHDAERKDQIGYPSDPNEKLFRGQMRATLTGHAASVYAVAFAADGKTLASGGGDFFGKNDFAIRLWFAATDAEVARQRTQ